MLQLDSMSLHKHRVILWLPLVRPSSSQDTVHKNGPEGLPCVMEERSLLSYFLGGIAGRESDLVLRLWWAGHTTTAVQERFYYLSTVAPPHPPKNRVDSHLAHRPLYKLPPPFLDLSVFPRQGGQIHNRPGARWSS